MQENANIRNKDSPVVIACFYCRKKRKPELLRFHLQVCRRRNFEKTDDDTRDAQMLNEGSTKFCVRLFRQIEIALGNGDQQHEGAEEQCSLEREMRRRL